MRTKRFFRFLLGLALTAGCLAIASSVTYDHDDVYAAKDAADTTGPFILIGICTGIYALVQLVKMIRNI